MENCQKEEGRWHTFQSGEMMRDGHAESMRMGVFVTAI
jgi:hypothetical protein